MSNDNNPFRYKARAVRFAWVSAIMALCLILAIIAVAVIIYSL